MWSLYYLLKQISNHLKLGDFQDRDLKEVIEKQFHWTDTD